MLTSKVLTEVSVGITQLKTNPMAVLEEGKGAAIAVLNRNKPSFYAVPAALYESMIDRLEDVELTKMAETALLSGDFEEVSLDDL